MLHLLQKDEEETIILAVLDTKICGNTEQTSSDKHGQTRLFVWCHGCLEMFGQIQHVESFVCLRLMTFAMLSSRREAYSARIHSNTAHKCPPWIESRSRRRGESESLLLVRKIFCWWRNMKSDNSFICVVNVRSKMFILGLSEYQI